MSVNSFELNPEEEGDDSSFQMYDDSTKVKMPKDLACTELELMV